MSSGGAAHVYGYIPVAFFTCFEDSFDSLVACRS